MHPIAVDSTGKYYMESGPCGLLHDIAYLEDDPAQVNYVSNTMTTKESNMVCLYRLDEPITVYNANGGAVNIIYYGIMQRMEQLNKYLDCDAYDDNNVVYIIDNDGLKLLNSDRTELIQGYNVYSALLNMDYLHGNSFDQTLEKLKSTGSAYSNVVLNGTEYYYGLKKLDYAEWTILFLVPSEYVATNTVRLVSIVTWIMLIFALAMAGVTVAVIFILLRAQQYENDRDRNARHSQREYQHDPRNDTYQPDGICRNVFGRHEKQYRPLRVIQLFQPVVILGAV